MANWIHHTSKQVLDTRMINFIKGPLWRDINLPRAAFTSLAAPGGIVAECVAMMGRTGKALKESLAPSPPKISPQKPRKDGEGLWGQGEAGSGRGRVARVGVGWVD